MGSKLSGFAHALYNPKRREFLGRDGAGWAKLGIFYFFFYLGLAGFFCAMLAVFMAVTPRDHPRYYGRASSMKTRSNPLTPGLGFRPQPIGEQNIVFVDTNRNDSDNDPYVKNLNQFLEVHYRTRGTENEFRNQTFSMNTGNICTSNNRYGFAHGEPCVLVKMNKIVGFEPEPGYPPEDTEAIQTAGIRINSNEIPIYCYGEYPADADNIGDITYFSEGGRNNKYGTLKVNRFPYKGKSNRKDVYQAPYVWAQFTNTKRNVLINVICRAFAKNIYFDRKTARGLTRFQIFIQDLHHKSF